MTVGELIKELENYDENLLVLTDGYESGFEDIRLIEELVVKDNGGEDWDIDNTEDDDIEVIKTKVEDTVWYYGDYSQYVEKIHTGIEPIPAIILSRN
jgi:hypothetical protein